MDASSFTVDAGRVVHETIDDEAILVDLETGMYFSLSGSGPEIWNLLVAGTAIERVLDVLVSRHDTTDAALIRESAYELVDQLCRAGLLVPDGSEAGRHTSESALAAPPVARGLRYEAPVLQAFTDMEYFLLLDPVHDVEESGWPHFTEPASEKVGAPPPDRPTRRRRRSRCPARSVR